MTGLFLVTVASMLYMKTLTMKQDEVVHTVDVTSILRVYNAEMTKQILDGQLKGKQVEEFMGTIDKALRTVLREMSDTKQTTIYLKDAVLSPSQDVTEEVLLLMARRYPELRTHIQSMQAPVTTSEKRTADSTPNEALSSPGR